MSETYRFELCPVAASRPRVSKFGHAYFSGPYKAFKERCTGIVPATLGVDFEPRPGRLRVNVECVVTRPKTTKLDSPRGDVDNFAKAVLDAMNDRLWEDDKQIEELTISKRWMDEPGVEGYFEVTIEEIK
jgi:Holliday junction resolvase RusA-like endonuclease